jgi:hypothetical protein
MNEVTAQFEGILLAYILGFVSLLALTLRPAAVRRLQRWMSEKDAHRYFEAGLAIVMAYGFFATAALLANARVPDFFHEHLLDGLALAALVALLVKIFPRDRPGEALPRIRRPCWILALFTLGGGVIFGLVGATGAYEAGTGWFLFFLGAGGSALFGAIIFAYAYLMTIHRAGVYRGRWGWLTWWFKKRPESAAPEPAAAAEPGPAVRASVPQPDAPARASSAPR